MEDVMDSPSHRELQPVSNWSQYFGNEKWSFPFLASFYCDRLFLGFLNLTILGLPLWTEQTLISVMLFFSCCLLWMIYLFFHCDMFFFVWLTYVFLSLSLWILLFLTFGFVLHESSQPYTAMFYKSSNESLNGFCIALCSRTLRVIR